MLRNIKNIERRNIECQLIYLLFSFSVGIAGMCTYQLNPVAVDKGGFLRYDIDLVNERGLLVCAILSIMAYLLITVVDKGAHQTNVATMKPYNENRVFWSTFIIYSFLGWVMESIVRTISEKKLINTGFLHGPFCPIYGIGAIILFAFLDKFENNLK